MGEDYTEPTLSYVTIRQGDLEAFIDVPVVADDLYEVDETLEVELLDPDDPDDPRLLNLDQARRRATGTILNDDEPPCAPGVRRPCRRK